MAQRMQIVHTNQGTLGTYIFEVNPTGFGHTERQFTDRERSVDASQVEFFRGAKNIFVLDFDYIGTAQFAQMGTIWREHAKFAFWPFNEDRGTTGSYQVTWINDFEFSNLGPSWANGYRGKAIFEEV